jgi:hypothetical protein
MSEYKYACPVCGQHMRCDSSQAGTVMECPTCFQKITAPQAPAAGDSQKFVLTGTKVGERPLPKVAAESPAAAPASRNFPWVIFIVVLSAGLVGAGVFFFVGKRPGGKTSLPSAKSVPASAWQAGDIGDVGKAGSFSQAKGVYTVNGSGADTWRQADGFYYVSLPLTGDGSLTAEILNIQNTHEWAKAGVMIRETADAGSAFAFANIRADGQAQFIWRKAAGAEAEASGLAGGPGYPKWVKIARSGNNFSAYYKVNAGDEWQPLGSSQSFEMAPQTQIGMAVCAHVAGVLNKAQFDQIALQSEPGASPAAEPSVPKPVLPPASDTNWTLSLDTVTTPDAAAVGRIHGQSSTLNRAVFQGGVLTFRPSVRGSPDVSLVINFGGALPEALAGNTINVTTNAEQAAGVLLRWKENGQNAKQNFDNGYALRLEMGPLANNHMPGKIYFCAPDESKSYVMGTFNVEVRKPKPPKPKK